MLVDIYFAIGAIVFCAVFGWFYYNEKEHDDIVFCYIIIAAILGLVWPLTVTTFLFIEFYKWVDNR